MPARMASSEGGCVARQRVFLFLCFVKVVLADIHTASAFDGDGDVRDSARYNGTNPRNESAELNEKDLVALKLGRCNSTDEEEIARWKALCYSLSKHLRADHDVRGTSLNEETRREDSASVVNLTSADRETARSAIDEKKDAKDGQSDDKKGGQSEDKKDVHRGDGEDLVGVAHASIVERCESMGFDADFEDDIDTEENDNETKKGDNEKNDDEDEDLALFAACGVVIACVAAMCCFMAYRVRRSRLKGKDNVINAAPTVTLGGDDVEKGQVAGSAVIGLPVEGNSKM